MNKYLSPKILLLLILLIATFLRFSNLNSNPPGLNWDEAAWGYNAYSLGIDGRDEFGKFLPFKYLESYGDYKPPVYAYLGVIPVKVFGLNPFAVRFPSAVLGVFTVLITYFLVKEIFYKTREDPRIEFISLFSAFFLAISPWHIMLSRGAYEANVSTFFIVLGIFSFLKAMSSNKWYLVISAVSLAFSFYTFNTARIFVPLIGLVLVLIFRKEIFKVKKEIIIALVVGAALITALLPFLFSPQAKLRYQEVNIFSDINIVKTANQEIANDNDAIWSRIIHNRRVAYAREFLKHYFDNLNPNFLFITGDGNPRFSTQDVGQLYLWDLPFLILGIFILIRRKEGNYLIIPIWLLLGIIPAAAARETPHALRIETVIPTFQIIIAYGFVELLYLFKKRRQLIGVSLIGILCLNLIYFYHGYVKHYAREYSSEWQYSYKEAVSFVTNNKQRFGSVMITEELGRPYIYFLLYDKFDPRVFRQQAKIDREVFGFVHIRSFDKYKFVKSIDTSTLNQNTLYLDVPKNVPQDVKILKTFYLLNGERSLVAYETNK